jgi:hypothetical protein
MGVEQMLETYSALLTDVIRNLKKNIRDSPLLYTFFGFMMFASIVGMSYITLFLIWTNADVDLYEIFLMIFFIMLMKSGVDFHKHFVKSSVLSYPLSTPVKHVKTTFEIFLLIFWLQLGLWAFFSINFSILLVIGNVNLGYPIEYLQFTMGVMLATIIGTIITIHYFSKNKFRLAPIPFIFLALWFFREPIFTLIILILSAGYLAWSLSKSIDCYLYVNRKERINEGHQIKIYDEVKAIFHKEVIILWRDRLLFSFIFTAVIVGAISGFLAEFGGEDILPDGIRHLTQYVSPVMYGFLGVYVLTIYTAVFTSLNFFLAEENTVWVIRNLPVKAKTIVHGKALALTIPFICSIPFVAYFSAFTGLDMIPSTLWLLIFAFIVGLTVSFPLGTKYMGKKSDVLLLYSVAMIIFGILGFVLGIENLVSRNPVYLLHFYLSTIAIAVFFMFLSFELSAHIFTLKFKQQLA